jgi:hypothetical protein
MDGMAGLARYPGPYGDDYLAPQGGASGCVGYVVDGAPYVEMTRGDIDTFVRPAEVGAIEVYQPGQAPAQYRFTPRATGSMIVTTQGPPPPPGGFRDSRIMADSNVTEAMAQIARERSGGVRGTGCVKIVVWTKIRLGLP